MQRLATDERHAQLVDGARRLFSEHSFDELSTAEIARRLGVSKALLFHYFGTKRGLYVASVQAAVDELIRVTEPDPAKPPAVQLWECMAAYLNWARSNHGEQHQVMTGGIGFDEEVVAIVERPRQITYERVLRALDISPEDATTSLQMAVAGWIGFAEGVARHWAPRVEAPIEPALTQIVATLQTALATSGVPRDTIERLLR